MWPGSLEDIADAVGGWWHDADGRQPATGRLRIDSRDVEPGDVFLALPGSKRDGHDFAVHALSRDAAAVILRSDRPRAYSGPKLIVPDTRQALWDLARWHRRQLDALIIGVTGSVGKTTTRELIHALLCGQHEGVRSQKNFNNEIGLPLSLLDIQANHEFAVLELGASRVGDIARLTDLAQPEVGVITAIGSAHLATFGSVEGIMQGKGELLDALPAGGFAVLPGDCPRLRSISRRAKCRVIFAGEGIENHIRVSGIEQTDVGLRFRVDGQLYRLPLFGRHNITNAMCALTIGREIGIPNGILADCLADFQPVAGRTHVRHIGHWTVIDDTYNASPQAFAAALQTLQDIPTRNDARRIVIAGDMLELGATSADEHRQLGEQIGRRNIDRLLVIGDHADDVAQGAMSAGLPPHRIAAPNDWDAFLLLLECWLEAGDVVLVKGSRGMRMERVIDWMMNAASDCEDPTVQRRRAG
jgi:UDP-N-acetylmuramoyl-tripeptide--D-alanyl-D-alanine ligase